MKFSIKRDYLGTFDLEYNKRKNSNIQMFQIQGGCVFSGIIKMPRPQNLDIKSNFKLVDRKFVRCFIAQYAEFQEIWLNLSP